MTCSGRPPTVAKPTDRAWCGDLTYAPTRGGWLFLSVLLDLHSRRAVGWATCALFASLQHRAFRGEL